MIVTYKEPDGSFSRRGVLTDGSRVRHSDRLIDVIGLELYG